MRNAVRSIEGVCASEVVAGAQADALAPPDLLLEVAHGATLFAHFEQLRRSLRGSYGDDLRDFFAVNTDVGAPELAAAMARRLVEAEPRRKALVVRCLVPRTFIDCNRRIDRDAVASASQAGEMTPGLPPWVRDPHDRQHLLDRYFAYRDVVSAAFDRVCGAGGLAMCVHTYAPRSIDVAVDEHIGTSLRAAYAPERITTWPLRAPIDLITHDPDGRELAAPVLARQVEERLMQAGFEVAHNGTYSLHPISLAHGFAVQYPGSTLCFEVRRDLLLTEFVPFCELTPLPALVERVARPLVAAVAASFS